MREFGAQPGTTYDSRWWEAVHCLYQEAFPGLPAGIATAAAAGVSWAAMTTPFALFEGERCVAHVGVMSHPLRLGGRDVLAAGVHAVCTAEDRQLRGLCRRLMRAALAWADATHPVAKLSTDDPPVYTSHGFRPVQTYQFASSLEPAAHVARRPLRPLEDPADASLFADLLRRRAPASQVLSTADSGWLVTIDAALSGRLEDRLWYLPEHDAAVLLDADPGQGANFIVDVIAPTLPPGAVVLGAASDPSLDAIWTFAPDLLDPAAVPVPLHEDAGAFMVRGEWPADLPEFGISPVWEH